jgi:hypothetical protein
MKVCAVVSPPRYIKGGKVISKTPNLDRLREMIRLEGHPPKMFIGHEWFTKCQAEGISASAQWNPIGKTLIVCKMDDPGGE